MNGFEEYVPEPQNHENYRRKHITWAALLTAHLQASTEMRACLEAELSVKLKSGVIMICS